MCDFSSLVESERELLWPWRCTSLGLFFGPRSLGRNWRTWSKKRICLFV